MRVHPVCWAKFRAQQRCPQQLLTTMCERGRERSRNIIVNSISRPTLADFSSRSSSFCPPLTEARRFCVRFPPVTPHAASPFALSQIDLSDEEGSRETFRFLPLSYFCSQQPDKWATLRWGMTHALGVCVCPCTCVCEQVCKIYLASSDESQQQQN